MGNGQLGQFNNEQIQRLSEKFRQLDRDGSGDLDFNEIFTVPELSNNPLVQRVITIFDTNKDGKISFKQFITGLASLYTSDQNKRLEFAFRIYDIDEDGYITNGELYKVLKIMVGANLTEVQLQQLVDRTIIRADLDFDGRISFGEFRNMIKDLNVINKFNVQKI